MKDFAVSIDPGTRGCGVAAWRKGCLAAAGFAKSPIGEGSDVFACVAAARAVVSWLLFRFGDLMLGDIEQLAIEFPQIYQRGGGKTKGNPNHLTPLAAVDGALAAMLPLAKIHTYHPHDWKGSVEKPKKVSEPYPITAKVEARLEQSELAVITWPENGRHRWDVVDALGVGLHHLGRFERRQVFARE